MKNLFAAAFLLICCTTFSAQKVSQKKTEEKPEKEIKKNQSCSFMQFGIMSRNHDEFKKKYGVTVNYQNCVISPFLSKEAKENNTLVANQLTDKYGDVWKKDLGFIPYGL